MLSAAIQTYIVTHYIIILSTIVASELLAGRRRRFAENRRRQDFSVVAIEKNQIHGRVLPGRPGHERYIESGVKLSALQGQIGFQFERVVTVPKQKYDGQILIIL